MAVNISPRVCCATTPCQCFDISTIHRGSPGSVYDSYCATPFECLKLQRDWQTPRGEVTQVSKPLLGLPSPNSLMSIADVQRDPPQSTGFGDSSRPLLSIYSKVTEEIDNRVTERCQKDAESVLVFVSPHINVYTTLHINWDCRLVYSLPLSVDCLQCRCRISSPTLRICQRSISLASISSSPTLMLRTRPFLPLRPSSRHLDMLSG
jgi:hypothetical protein